MVTKNVRGSGAKDRGNRVPYVNPNPSQNLRGGGTKKLSGRKRLSNLGAGYKQAELDAIAKAEEWQDEKARRKKARSRNRQFGSLRYPFAMLHTDSDYLEIKVLEYSAPGFEKSQAGQALRLQTSSESLKNQEKILGMIYLPIPESITDSNGVTWGEDRLNGFAAAGLGIASDMITSGNVAEAITAGANRTKDAVGKLLGDQNTVNATNSVFAAAAVNALGARTSATGILARQSGAILNPNMELLFNGVQLRSFSFNFDFAPRDENESKIIRSIVRAFKKSLNAKNGSKDVNSSGLFIGSPDVFQLTYKTGGENHEFLHKFKPMALLNMVVNHTGAGTYATYDNTAPVHTKIDLTFQELEPIYSEDYEDGQGVEGTGF
tara:strand:+ start:850 stop:1983 length:1134 start_codon:yes stop_codon:yes gene_type:complete